MTTDTDSSIKVTMKMEKETKNTIRFEEVHLPTEFPVIKNCYISKQHHATLGSPKVIVLTIEAGA